MPVYLIANLTVTDPARFQTYREQVPAVIAQYGGRYLVRGGTVHNLEGDLGLDRCVMLEFPSLAAAQAFHASPEYAPLLQIRAESTRSQIVLIEGLPPV